MKLLTLMCLFISLKSQAYFPPTNFGDDSRGNKNVFVDFKEAKSTITYDLADYTVVAETEIQFYQPEAGHPIFDIIPTINEMSVDGNRANASLIYLPEGVSQVHALDQSISEGHHQMKISNTIENLVSFDSYNKTVRSAFWMSDLSDRRYLERYLPTNLEYDQYQNTFEIKIINTTKEHQIYANGEVREIGFNHFEITFPEHYTCSSIFFHLVEKDAHQEVRFTYNSIDGRQIPVTIYSDYNLEAFQMNTQQFLAELEGDYGPWPHNHVIVYGAGMGGMEYSGATRTSLSALGHELHHSYFARNMMPARGNAGWIDEALASWRDNGYPRGSVGSLEYSRMGGHSIYRRTTDTEAYGKGARLMAYFNYRLEEKGGLRPFLKEYFHNHQAESFLTSTFKTELEAYLGQQLDNIFNPYVFGRANYTEELLPITETQEENPMHPHMTDNELMMLL